MNTLNIKHSAESKKGNKMTATMEYVNKELQDKEQPGHYWWQRIMLLSVLGYEAAGCLSGGSLLIASPDGRYMEMPVDIMHGAFRDFLIPGIILFGLGILNTLAFFSVLRRSDSDWLLAGLAMGGLTIWFIVEIIILQALHWLHYMWGFPVFLGCMAAMPQFVFRHDTALMRKTLLSCGILSSIWYIAINIFVPMMYEGYSMVSVTVSEMSAIGAPTRILWDLLVIPYPLLFVAFGWGVLKSSAENRHLHVVGVLIIVYSVVNFYWPPMHQRAVIASGGGTHTDTMHIVWATMTLLFMMLLMGYGAAASNKRFRIYTIITWILFMFFGILTFMESPGIEKNLPTPYIGLWERINIGAFMLWVIVFTVTLLRKNTYHTMLRGNKSTNA